MKKKVIAWIICLSILLQVTPVAATEKEILEAWQLTNVELEHTTIEFQLSGIQSAQDATVVIEKTSLYTSENNTTVCELPFRISSSTEKINLSIPDGIPSGYYDVYVKDFSGKCTKIVKTNVDKHYFMPDCKLYPNWAEISNSASSSYNFSITIGFEEHKVELKSGSTQIIEYPTQKVGTVLQLKWWDEYGCADTYTGTIRNENLSIPSLYVSKDSIIADFINLGINERVVAEVEGKTYYSDYGTGDDKRRRITDFITYPKVADTTTKIKVWMESKNGSMSEIKELTIEKCGLENCNRKCNAYLAKAEGTVKENYWGLKITRVSTYIDNVEYSCDVDQNGDFVLKYPSQDANKELVISYSDKHGCTINEKVTVTNAYKDKMCYVSVLPTKAYEKVEKDCRIAVQIGSDVYYSDYATNDVQVVYVNYPKQKAGQTISVWYELKDAAKSPIYNMTIPEREYDISANVRTSSIRGKVEGLDGEDKCDYTIYVKVGEKEYKCNQKRRIEDDYDDDDTDSWSYNYNFSCDYPIQKVGSSIEVIIRDNQDYEYSESFKMENIKPSLKFGRLNTSSTKMKGSTVAGSKLTVKIGKRTYKGKANKNGDFSFKIKAQKAGTKILVTTVTPEGYSNKKTGKVSGTYGYPELANYIYHSSGSAKISVFGGNKNDKLKVSIGDKKYTIKLRRNKRKQHVMLKIKKPTTGSKIKIVLYDKFGKKKDSYTDRVYIGNKIYVGMSTRDAVLTTWGAPVRKNNWGTGTLQWVFESDSSTLYAYIRNGRVSSIQHLNY